MTSRDKMVALTGCKFGRFDQGCGRICQSEEYRAVRKVDRRISGAESEHGLERGQLAASYDDVVCVVVVHSAGGGDRGLNGSSYS
jgi:hypothetical protein